MPAYYLIGVISVMHHFQNIGITGRDGEGVPESLKVLTDFLVANQLTVILSRQIAGLFPNKNLQISSNEELGESCDLIIVVGGDGSLLGAARMLAKYGVPVLGVNRGRLGFLTDIKPDEIEASVTEVLKGNYSVEKRFLLDVVVMRNGKVIGQGDALNDVVVNSGTSARMIEFDLAIENDFVYNQRSDGLIVCTPTGSTAYSLSGGGPIMHPSLDAIGIVPMFPHTLSSRPIVVDGNSEIKITIHGSNQIHPPVTCDGQVTITASPGDCVHIRKKSHKLILIHPPGHSFYASCRGKLGWSTRLGD
ncbi:NAD(+) kinase [Dasania marina]|uniref:NAD(+) kinase n=1 Tax=Dasania marina TaxID=471499 RepID=UPI000370A69E|nr:NAD(+) kinase [Dasania marina]